MWSVVCGVCRVWSVECRVWSVKCTGWSVECHHMSCDTCHAIGTVSPLDAARLAKNTQRDTSEVLRLPRKMTLEVSKVLRLSRHMQHIFCKPHKKYYACHTKQKSRHLQPRENVRKCDACHAKRHYNLLSHLQKGWVSQLPP